MRRWIRPTICLLAAALLAGALDDPCMAKKKKKGKKDVNAYAEFVWPPPPDEARIQLVDVISGRADVVAKSGFRRMLMSNSPQAIYDKLRKPYAVAFDLEGRILVTDSGNSALIRFDRANRQMDVFGTRGSWTLKTPLGLTVGPDGTIYVADAGQAAVLAFGPEGSIRGVYGSKGGVTNPTDATVSPDGSELFVADSKGHQIVVFDLETAEIVSTFGDRGSGRGEFNFPTSLAFGPEGNLYVVDQMNFRVQQFDADGEYLDEFGTVGRGPGNFLRPKDIAVDEVGFIYVTDNSFNNLQLFDVDFAVLTFVGQPGSGPGRFNGASGVAVRGDEFAVVDQIGTRVQLFRFVVPKDY